MVAALNGTEPVQWHRADELKMNHERAISDQRGRGLLDIVLRTFECGRYAAVHDRTRSRPAGHRREEGWRLFRLMNANALNGLGMGMVGPFIAYWFNIRFGVGPDLSRAA